MHFREISCKSAPICSTMCFIFGVTFLLIAGTVYCAPPKLPCSAPIPPEHGQAFLHEEGHLVKYACEPGFALEGEEAIRCVEGKWEDPNPVCLEIGSEYKSFPKALETKVENEKDVQISNSTEGAMLGDDEGYQSDDSALRQLYWYTHYYHTGAPPVMTMTDSQLAWINSLHPQLRDEYLKGMYVMRVGSSAEPERVQALVARDAYNYVYHVPYVRRPVSLIVDDPINAYDYSCSQTGYPFIKAPRLPNMQLERYDTRQNPNKPNGYYLAALYRCKAGYEMLDTRYTELYCSNMNWVGVRPVCVRRG